jgi:hypothetical protein
MLESIAQSEEPETPVLGCKISRALEPNIVGNKVCSYCQIFPLHHLWNTFRNSMHPEYCTLGTKIETCLLLSTIMLQVQAHSFHTFGYNIFYIIYSL